MTNSYLRKCIVAVAAFGLGTTLSATSIAQDGATAAGAGAADRESSSSRLDRIVVTGTRTEHSLLDAPVETFVITSEDIERMPSQNITDILKSVPGINTSMLDDVIGSDNLRSTMRGLQFNEGYGLILIDGQRVHGGLGAHGDYGVSLTQIPVAMIERIEVVKGASSSLYGADAMAGVINIITKSVPDRATGSAGVSYGRYNMLDRNGAEPDRAIRNYSRTHVSYGDRVGNDSGYYLSFSREQDEDTGESPLTNQRDFLLGKWHSPITEELTLDLGLELSKATRDIPTESIARYDRNLDSYRYSAGLTWARDAYEVRARAYTYNQEFIQGFEGFEHGYRFGDVGYDQAEVVGHYHGRQHLLTVGAETQSQNMDYVSFNYLTDPDIVTDVTVDETIRTHSLFIQDEISLMDNRLTLVPGVRYEDHSTFGGEVNPKFSAMFRARPDTTLRASVGRAFKSPTIRQLYYDGLLRHDNSWRQSNPDLEPEVAIAWTANLEQRMMQDRVWLSFGLFRTDIDDKVIRTDTGETLEGLPIESFINVDEAYIQGAEISLRAEPHRDLSVYASVSYTDSENKQSGNDLPFVPNLHAMIAPTYFYAPLAMGISGVINWVDEQYRNDANTQRVRSHTTLDARIWSQLSENAQLSLEARNITDSDKGDGEFAQRTGRSLGVSLNIDF